MMVSEECDPRYPRADTNYRARMRDECRRVRACVYRSFQSAGSLEWECWRCSRCRAFSRRAWMRGLDQRASSAVAARSPFPSMPAARVRFGPSVSGDVSLRDTAAPWTSPTTNSGETSGRPGAAPSPHGPFGRGRLSWPQCGQQAAPQWKNVCDLAARALVPLSNWNGRPCRSAARVRSGRARLHRCCSINLAATSARLFDVVTAPPRSHRPVRNRLSSCRAGRVQDCLATLLRLVPAARLDKCFHMNGVGSGP